MPYVPRCRHDIFVSYSHNDDRTWINAFEQRLVQELRERLGQEPSIWQDDKDIRLGQNWKDDIREAITGTAVFVTILSPGYQASEWCGRERKCFLEQFPNFDDMKVPLKVGTAYRFIKILKTPWDDDAHLEFFNEAQHLEFFQRDSAGRERDLVPGTAPFRARLEEAAHQIAAILRAMRRMGEAVFVASAAEDVLEAREDLRSELRVQGYVVRPQGPLDSLYTDKAIKKEIDSVLLSVHLLGAQYNEFAARQIRLALDLGKKIIFWIPKGILSTPDSKQRQLLQSIRNAEGITSPFALCEGTSVRSMIAEVLHALKANPIVRPVKNGGGLSVYLICDRSAKQDSDFAESLRDKIQDTEGLKVLLPEAKTQVGVSIEELHQERLRECDGVLLYRSAAPLPWLQQQAPGVLLAEQILQRPAFRAKAFLVNDLSVLPGFPNLILRPSEFDLKVLEPFLAPLRPSGEAHAGC